MAKQQTFDVIFSGEIIDGFAVSAVKDKASQIFKMDSGKVESLFQGKSLTLKKNIDEAAANKYQKILSNIGMQVYVAENSASAGVVAASESQVGSVGNPSAKMEAPVSSEPATSVANWTLNPVGVRLTDVPLEGSSNAAKVVVPDYILQPYTHLTLEKNSESELFHVSPEVESFTIKDVGEDLLNGPEKAVIAKANVDVSDISVSDVGSDLLTESERREFVERQVDVSNIRLVT